MENTIANQNSARLANLSVSFCAMNGLDSDDPELVHVLSAAVITGINKWYDDNGRTDFNPSKELICDDAIIFAFEKAQEIVILATISAQMGINPEGLID
jgi:hypothetical protein